MHNIVREKKTITILATVATLSAIIFVYSYSTFAQASPSQNPSSMQPNVVHHTDVSPAEFFKHGGRSVIQITPSTPAIDIARGSTGKIILTVSHISGANPLTKITAVSHGIANTFIPYYKANLTTDKERAHLLAEGKPIPGAIDLNQLVTFSTKQVALTPGEAGQIQADISIPRDWPSQMVGNTVFFSLAFGTAENYQYPDLMLEPTGFSVHITS